MDRYSELTDRHRWLLGLVADLGVELAAVVESQRVGTDDEHDPEGSTIGYERARLEALLDRTRASLLSVEVALEQRDGADVRCETCGATIEAERIAALVVVTQCAVCARADEAVRRLGTAR